ncbi:MAG: DUF503 domain-containing protein [Candidatus Omnitrophica bacterium]|nr:DUF503 domain-containing protein [Candidatus Omnitrophota bacterium]MDD5488669.1 DUF503 domain-containing protein [Candidatus Omnitrophota bacterium]
MHLSVISIELYIKSSRSLKDKRSVLKSLKERMRARFNVSVAETGKLDKWQAAELAIAIVSNDRTRLSKEVDGIMGLVDGYVKVVVLDHHVEYL